MGLVLSPPRRAAGRRHPARARNRGGQRQRPVAAATALGHAMQSICPAVRTDILPPCLDGVGCWVGIRGAGKEEAGLAQSLATDGHHAAGRGRVGCWMRKPTLPPSRTSVLPQPNPNLLHPPPLTTTLEGAAMTNGMFMRRGSSLIELRPVGFSGRESWPNIYMKVRVCVAAGPTHAMQQRGARRPEEFGVRPGPGTCVRLCEKRTKPPNP